VARTAAQIEPTLALHPSSKLPRGPCHRSKVIKVPPIIRRPREAGVPPAELGFRLVVDPSPSVAAAIVWNVTKLLRRA